MSGSIESETGVSSSSDMGARGSGRDSVDAAPDRRHELAYSDELKRKALHLLALIIPLFMWFAGRTSSILLLGVVACLALTADVLRVRSERFAGVIYRFFHFIMRPEECPEVGGPIVLNGATWVVLSATLLAVLFPLEIAVLSFTAFMIADAAAAIVGRGFGRHRWHNTTRTVEGSTAFFIAGVAVMIIFGWTSVWISILAVLAGAVAEIPYRPLNDNIRVPLVIGIVIHVSQLIAA